MGKGRKNKAWSMSKLGKATWSEQLKEEEEDNTTDMHASWSLNYCLGQTSVLYVPFSICPSVHPSIQQMSTYGVTLQSTKDTEMGSSFISKELTKEYKHLNKMHTSVLEAIIETSSGCCKSWHLLPVTDTVLEKYYLFNPSKQCFTVDTIIQSILQMRKQWDTVNNLPKFLQIKRDKIRIWAQSTELQNPFS